MVITANDVNTAFDRLFRAAGTLDDCKHGDNPGNAWMHEWDVQTEQIECQRTQALLLQSIAKSLDLIACHLESK